MNYASSLTVFLTSMCPTLIVDWPNGQLNGKSSLIQGYDQASARHVIEATNLFAVACLNKQELWRHKVTAGKSRASQGIDRLLFKFRFFHTCVKWILDTTKGMINIIDTFLYIWQSRNAVGAPYPGSQWGQLPPNNQQIVLIIYKIYFSLVRLPLSISLPLLFSVVLTN